MNAKFSFPMLLLLVLFSTQISLANESAEVLVRKAVSETSAASTPAIAELRSLGPAGLQVLMTTYADEIDHHVANPHAKSDAEWQRITKALDAVSGQKNSYLSGLYWYTDLDKARKASLESGKPILSLRLLGKLTDELSCANSRYFRTVLYANAEVASLLREHFVLHWQSVRPAPVITIDFGDGRKYETTITGNSIHYVLDSEGQLIDALPGLYGPRAFLRGLADAEGLFHSLKKSQDKKWKLFNYYSERLNKISVAWFDDVTKIGGKAPQNLIAAKGANGELLAVRVAPLAVTKMMTEASMLRAVSGVPQVLERITDETSWRKIAQLHASESRLDSRSVALIRRQSPSLSENELADMVRKFEESIALDTVRNEYMLHSKLYDWLASDPTRADLEKFDEKVYAELFLTPRSDPWLGLVSAGVYAALDNGGIK